MPLYDYRCECCGDFRELRPMVESSTSQRCPVCGAPSERVISAPFLAGKDQNNLFAGRRNDQTRVPWRATCGHGCSHSHGA